MTNDLSVLEYLANHIRLYEFKYSTVAHSIPIQSLLYTVP